MCLVSKPKIPDASATSTTQNMPIIRNPLLDGLASTEQQGNNPFRIDLINPLTIPGSPQVGSVAGSAPSIAGSGSATGGTGVAGPARAGRDPTLRFGTGIADTNSL